MQKTKKFFLSVCFLFLSLGQLSQLNAGFKDFAYYTTCDIVKKIKKIFKLNSRHNIRIPAEFFDNQCFKQKIKQEEVRNLFKLSQRFLFNREFYLFSAVAIRHIIVDLIIDNENRSLELIQFLIRSIVETMLESQYFFERPFNEALCKRYKERNWCLMCYFLNACKNLCEAEKKQELYKLVQQALSKEFVRASNQGYSLKIKEEFHRISVDIYYNELLQSETLLKFFLDHGADIDYQDENGDTALHWFVRNKRVGLIEFLIKNNAAIDIHNKSGESAIGMKDGLFFGEDYRRVVNCFGQYGIRGFEKAEMLNKKSFWSRFKLKK
ncbi:ankyrin repeat domain-containing protein [Candidatus Babeliales bacterium]|nr:ankyrin repeat domain-containing protein [Candidatus Babeliales bacterium]